MAKYTSQYKINQKVKFLDKNCKISGIIYTESIRTPENIRYNLLLDEISLPYF